MQKRDQGAGFTNNTYEIVLAAVHSLYLKLSIHRGNVKKKYQFQMILKI